MPPTSVPSHALGRYVATLASEWDIDAPGQAWQEIDSTLCFVDLSGFTQLSERLARRGRIGVEELTEVLNRVFGRMLDLAHARRGSLVKFGGDALLLHFTGADHAVHAASAAVEMRAALRQAAQYRTSVGRVPLRMSVGIHSGVVHLFRVGESHQELVLAGPAATRVALAESAAGAGDILVTPETARRLPAGAVGQAKGPGFLLRWRRGPVPAIGPRPRRSVTTAEIVRCMPIGLRGFLTPGGIEPEHRAATVGFVKFEGIDALMAASGADAVAGALDELVSTVQRIVDAAGVTLLATDLDKDGGKMILVTGVPFTREDDDGRMMRAAREIADADVRLDVRIGVNRGHVFAGEVGSAHRTTFTVMGDTVNLAARLMAAAPPGGVLASPEVLDRSRTLFEAEALEPFVVRGKSQPVQAYSVGRQLGPRTQTASGELPLFGREHELGVLGDAIRAVHRGQGTVVTIVGPTGIGKSRVIDEATALTEAMRTIRFHAEQAGSTSPYRGLRDPIRHLLGIDRADQATMAARLRAVVTERAPQLASMLPLLGDVTHIEVPPDPQVDRIDVRFRPERTADALIELLDASTSEPLVLVFEDAQWMDSATRLLVERMSAAVEHRSWLILIARRPDGDVRAATTGIQIELEPLSRPDAEAVVIAATAAAPLRPHDIALIVERAAGSPLFLGELLRMARGGPLDDLPVSLDAVVNAEIDAIGALPRRLVRYASVLGRSFRISVLRELVAADDIELADATLTQLGAFLDHDGDERLRFRQEMHREVAYQGLPFRRRRELHLRAGRITERLAGDAPDTVADLLARHYSLAHEHGLAWHHSRIAGDRARQRYANVEAATHYERAIDAARRLDRSVDADLLDVWRTLGDVRERLGMFEDAIAAYRRAAGLAASDPVARADLIWRRARARMHLGAYRVALAEATTGRRLVADREDRAATSVRARLSALQALLRQAQQRAVPALALADRAIGEARAAGDDEALARAYLVSDWANRVLGRNDAAPHGELALELYERLGDLDGAGKASNNLGAIAYFDGRWDESVKWYRRALDAYRQCGNDATAAVTASNLGELLVSRGSYEEADEVLRESIRVLRASRALDDMLFAELQLGRLLVERSEAVVAVELLTAVRAEAGRLGQAGYAFEASMHLASALAALGRFDEALHILDDAVREVGFVDPVYQSTLARVRASALAGNGLPDAARELLGEGLSSARAQGLAYEEALLLRAAARLDRAAGRPPARTALDAMSAILTRLNLELDSWDREPTGT